MKLTDSQVYHFQTFGFLVLRQAFDKNEMAVIDREFETMLLQDRDGRPFPGEQRQSLYSIVEKSALLTGFAADDRLYGVMEQLYGPGFSWLCSEGNLYVGDTPWHPDGTRLYAPPMKVSLYLDPLTKETGCLRVIPGSHLRPFHEDLKNMGQIGFPGPEFPCYPFESQPGDLLFANMNLWHAAFGGRVGRRHLAFNFFPEPATERHRIMMKENYDGLFPLIKRLQYSQPPRVFTDEFLYSDHPRIRRMCVTWVEMGLK